MTCEEWNSLKHGDRIIFTNQKYLKQVGTVEKIYVDFEGEKFIEGDKYSLFPLAEFDYDDFEIIKEGK